MGKKMLGNTEMACSSLFEITGQAMENQGNSPRNCE